MPTFPASINRSRALRHAAIALALGFATLRAHADCIAEAAARHQVNADVLRAIGWQESRLRPEAIGHNANGSTDVGAFQINSIHLGALARFGIGRSALADGCVCADVAAWHYRHQVDQRGNSWLAVGAYHSRTPARAAWYANQIAAILMRWQVLPPGELPYPAQRTLAPPAATPARAPVPSAAPPGTGATPAVRSASVAFSGLAYLPPAR